MHQQEWQFKPSVYLPMNPDFVDSLVEGEEIDQIRAKRIFRRKPDLEILAFDIVDDLDSSLGDLDHGLAMRVLAEQMWRSDNNVHAFERL